MAWVPRRRRFLWRIHDIFGVPQLLSWCIWIWAEAHLCSTEHISNKFQLKKQLFQQAFSVLQKLSLSDNYPLMSVKFNVLVREKRAHFLVDIDSSKLFRLPWIPSLKFPSFSQHSLQFSLTSYFWIPNYRRLTLRAFLKYTSIIIGWRSLQNYFYENPVSNVGIAGN